MQSLRKALLCCAQDSWIRHQLSLMLCSPRRTSPLSWQPRASTRAVAQWESFQQHRESEATPLTSVQGLCWASQQNRDSGTSQTVMSCCCFTGDKSTSLQWLIITSWFFAPPKDATIHILGNMGPSVAFPGTGGNTLPQALRQTGKFVKSWASSYCIAFRSTSASLHPHSQQGESKDMMTAKKYGPQTPSIHPLQNW